MAEVEAMEVFLFPKQVGRFMSPAVGTQTALMIEDITRQMRSSRETPCGQLKLSIDVRHHCLRELMCEGTIFAFLVYLISVLKSFPRDSVVRSIYVLY